MARDPAARRRALERMLLAEQAKVAARSANDVWAEWQRAATDYWVLLHPELERFRRGKLEGPPTIGDMEERAEQLGRAMRDVPDDWRLRPASDDRHERLARVGWFHEVFASLYEPVYAARDQLRAGDHAGVETLLRFLEADLYCFRSGYAKADVIPALCRADLDAMELDRLRAILFAVIEGYDRREFRAYCRIARRLDSRELRGELRKIAASGQIHTDRHARWVLYSMGER